MFTLPPPRSHQSSFTRSPRSRLCKLYCPQSYRQQHRRWTLLNNKTLVLRAVCLPNVTSYPLSSTPRPHRHRISKRNCGGGSYHWLKNNTVCRQGLRNFPGHVEERMIKDYGSAKTHEAWIEIKDVTKRSQFRISPCKEYLLFWSHAHTTMFPDTYRIGFM